MDRHHLFGSFSCPVMALRTRRNEPQKSVPVPCPGSLAHLRERDDGRVSVVPVGRASRIRDDWCWRLAMDEKICEHAPARVPADETNKSRDTAPRMNLSLQAWQYLVNRRVYCTLYKCRCGPLVPWTVATCLLEPTRVRRAALGPSPCRQKSTSRWHGLAINIFCCWSRTRGGNGTWLWLDPWERLALPPYTVPRAGARARAKAKARSRASEQTPITSLSTLYAIPSNHQPVTGWLLVCTRD